MDGRLAEDGERQVDPTGAMRHRGALVEDQTRGGEAHHREREIEGHGVGGGVHPHVADEGDQQEGLQLGGATGVPPPHGTEGGRVEHDGDEQQRSRDGTSPAGRATTRSAARISGRRVARPHSVAFIDHPPARR